MQGQDRIAAMLLVYAAREFVGDKNGNRASAAKRAAGSDATDADENAKCKFRIVAAAFG